MSDRLIGRIVRKDVGSGRPKGIMLEDALDALRVRCSLEYVSGEGFAGYGYSKSVYEGNMEGYPIRVEWHSHPLSIPSLIVEGMGEAWILVRSFLQGAGFFREYPKGQPRKRRMKIRQRRLI